MYLCTAYVSSCIAGVIGIKATLSIRGGRLSGGYTRQVDTNVPTLRRFWIRAAEAAVDGAALRGGFFSGKNFYSGHGSPITTIPP